MKILLHIVFRRRAHLGVHGDVGLHAPILSEPDHPVDLGERHAVFQIELEGQVVNHLVLLGHEVGY